MSLKEDLLNNLTGNNNCNSANSDFGLDDNESLPWENVELDCSDDLKAKNKSESLLSSIAKIDFQSNKTKMFLGISALLVFALAFCAYNIFASNNKIAVSQNNESISQTETEISVHIGGCVKKPGVYKLKSTDRIMDAVEAAGGLSENADSDQVNLAKVLDDGEQIIIPAKISQSTATSETESSGSSATNNGKVNINTADLATLQTLSGVGPSTAQKIIDYRNANGKFKSIDDLKKVSGIGEKTFAKFADKICV